MNKKYPSPFPQTDAKDPSPATDLEKEKMQEIEPADGADYRSGEKLVDMVNKKDQM